MMPNKELSIIIVNYKSEQFISRCIASAYACLPQRLSAEIIVVNNDMIDGSLLVKGFGTIKVIDHKKNVGFGTAANLGAKMAQGKHLLFLNPDSEVCSGNIEEVLNFFENDKNLAAIGSRIVSEDGTVQKWTAGKYANLYDLVRNNLDLPRSKDVWESKKMIPVDWVSGTALFVKKDTFHEIGGFDENFFMYFEDMDLCKRLRENNKEVFYCPTFCVKHCGGKSYSEKAWQKIDYYQSQEYYFKKHRNVFEAGIISLLRKIFFS